MVTITLFKDKIPNLDYLEKQIKVFMHKRGYKLQLETNESGDPLSKWENPDEEWELMMQRAVLQEHFDLEQEEAANLADHMAGHFDAHILDDLISGTSLTKEAMQKAMDYFSKYSGLGADVQLPRGHYKSDMRATASEVAELQRQAQVRKYAEQHAGTFGYTNNFKDNPLGSFGIDQRVGYPPPRQNYGITFGKRKRNEGAKYQIMHNPHPRDVMYFEYCPKCVHKIEVSEAELGGIFATFNVDVYYDSCPSCRIPYSIIKI